MHNNKQNDRDKNKQTESQTKNRSQKSKFNFRMRLANLINKSTEAPNVTNVSIHGKYT